MTEVDQALSKNELDALKKIPGAARRALEVALEEQKEAEEAAEIAELQVAADSAAQTARAAADAVIERKTRREREIAALERAAEDEARADKSELSRRLAERETVVRDALLRFVREQVGDLLNITSPMGESVEPNAAFDLLENTINRYLANAVLVARTPYLPPSTREHWQNTGHIQMAARAFDL